MNDALIAEVVEVGGEVLVFDVSEVFKSSADGRAVDSVVDVVLLSEKRIARLCRPE